MLKWSPTPLATPAMSLPSDRRLRRGRVGAVIGPVIGRVTVTLISRRFLESVAHELSMIARQRRILYGESPGGLGVASGSNQGDPRWTRRRGPSIITGMDAPPTSEAPPEEPTTAADATAAEPRPTRRLARSADDRVVAGVAAGIAEYYGFEPLLVRLAFVVASFFGGIGIVAYLVGWIVLPRPPSSTGAPARRADVKQLLGFGLVALGLAVIPGSVGFGIGGGAFWPLALIAIGVAVLWLRTRATRRRRGRRRARARGPPPTIRRPLICRRPIRRRQARWGRRWRRTPVTRTACDCCSAPPARSRRLRAPPAAAATRPTRPPRPPRPKSYLAAITASALLVLAGGAWLVDLAGIVDVDVAIVVALALAVVGIALVASAWYGRARGLIALGIVLALAVAAFGVLDVPFRGGIGDPTYRPPRVVCGQELVRPRDRPDGARSPRRRLLR